MATGEHNPRRKRLMETRRTWDLAAAVFDDEPDHGLRDPAVRAAWAGLLEAQLSPPPALVLDIGCGTGSLSVLLSELGHVVTGVDISPAMIDRAKAKAAAQGQAIEFRVMDAALPRFQAQQFDVIVCRHLLWALPEPGQVLQRWTRLLKRPGRLLLVEGFWSTGAGLHAKQVLEILPSTATRVTTQDLAGDPRYWGGEVTDERYCMRIDYF